MNRIQVSSEGGKEEGSLLGEFAALNRKRVFGEPALTLGEMERWQDLRDALSCEFGDGPESRDGVGAERREHIRHATNIRVMVNASEKCAARNISRGGMFIATERPLPTGSELSLHLEPPRCGRPLLLTGTVVRVETRGKLTACSGMAILFANLDGGQNAALKRLIEELQEVP